MSKITCDEQMDNNFIFMINSLPLSVLADTYDTLFCAGALGPTHLSHDSFESLAAITKPGKCTGNYVNCGKVSISLWQLYSFCSFNSPLSSIFFWFQEDIFISSGLLNGYGGKGKNSKMKWEDYRKKEYGDGFWWKSHPIRIIEKSMLWCMHSKFWSRIGKWTCGSFNCQRTFWKMTISQEF